MIKFSALVDELRRLGEEFPDKKSDASLLDGKIPVCIVGHALVNLGLDLEMRPPHYDEHGESHPDNWDIYLGESKVGKGDQDVTAMDWERMGISEPTKGEIDWAYVVQRKQDLGLPWECAVQEANRTVGAVV